MENWNLVMSLGFRGALVVDGRSFLCFGLREGKSHLAFNLRIDTVLVR